FKDDPIDGDQIEQTDGRWILGMSGNARLLHRHFGRLQIETRAGVQVRNDGIDNGLFHTRARERLGTRVDAGIVLFSYANPILAYGAPRFLADASAAGVDGLLVLDLPPEEMGDFREGLIAHGLDPIFLIAPTSSAARIRQAAALGRGFLYGISRLGVTGMRQEVGDAAAELATRVKAITEMPLALGFGVSEPDHVRAFQRIADAAVVGSRLVDAVARHGHEPDLPDRIEAMVRWLRGCGEKPQE
ncbi:MAG: tryptophan synthase subunit alpha, partial [Phycisphaerales bacterium]